MIIALAQLLLFLVVKTSSSSVYQISYFHQSATCSDDPYLESGFSLSECETDGAFASVSYSCSNGTLSSNIFTNSDCSGSPFITREVDLGGCVDAGDGLYQFGTCVTSTEPWDGKDGLLSVGFETDTCDCLAAGAYESYSLYYLGVCFIDPSSGGSGIYSSCAAGEYMYTAYTGISCNGTATPSTVALQNCTAVTDDADSSSANQYCSDSYPDSTSLGDCPSDDYGGAGDDIALDDYAAGDDGDDTLSSSVYQISYFHQSATCSDYPYLESGFSLSECETDGTSGSVSYSCSADGTLSSNIFRNSDCSGSPFITREVNLGGCVDAGDGLYQFGTCVTSTVPWEGKDGLLSVGFETDTCDCLAAGAYESYSLYYLGVCFIDPSSGGSGVYSSCADGEYMYTAYTGISCNGTATPSTVALQECTAITDDAVDDAESSSAKQYCSDSYPDSTSLGDCPSDDAAGDDAAGDDGSDDADGGDGDAATGLKATSYILVASAIFGTLAFFS